MMIVSWGRYLTRLIDVISIVLLSLLANKLFSLGQTIKWSDIILILSLGIGGISFSFLFSIYSDCHDRTKRENLNKSYTEYFSIVVNVYKGKLRLLWGGALLSLILFCFFMLCKREILPNKIVVNNTEKQSIVNERMASSNIDSLCIFR